MIPNQLGVFLAICLYDTVTLVAVLFCSMMMACFGGHLKVAHQLFEQGASVDTRDKGGSCCIHWAVDGGNTGCIQWLLDNAINV